MRHDAMTDAELGVLARAGEVEALAALLERWRPSLYATAIGLLRSREDALDAVQDTFLTALLHVSELRDGAAAKAWLHVVVRNVCLMQLRRRRELPCESVAVADVAPSLEELLDEHVMREWVWHALATLPRDERVAVILRYFSRCASYDAIARMTDVPTGTVRSRLSRARARLADALADTSRGYGDAETGPRTQWEEFYRALHEQPRPRTYRDLFVPNVDVRDRAGHWIGIETWSAHEREAITLGVRATILDVLASRDVTVLEIDFTNPAAAPDHCPPHATFIHRLEHGRSRQLRIHYPSL